MAYRHDSTCIFACIVTNNVHHLFKPLLYQTVNKLFPASLVVRQQKLRLQQDDLIRRLREASAGQ